MSDGRVMAYQEKGRYMNPWMGGRDSPLAFFLSWFRDKVGHNIFFLKLFVILSLHEVQTFLPDVWYPIAELSQVLQGMLS
jgi:hypothetical protein